MASERLTISEKDRIAKSIIKPIVEQSRKEFEDFGRFWKICRRIFQEKFTKRCY